MDHPVIYLNLGYMSPDPNERSFDVAPDNNDKAELLTSATPITKHLKTASRNDAGIELKLHLTSIESNSQYHD